MKKGWEEIKMVDACEILTCGVASTPTYVEEQIGVPFLSAQNVRDGEVVLEKFSFISKEFHQKLTNKNKPSQGDILYSRVGAKYGEAGVVEHSFEFSVYVSVTLIRPKRELLNNYFLKHYLNSPRIKDLAKKSISSSGVPNLNVNSVRDFLVPIPPLPEQQRIVAILDQAFSAIAIAIANSEQNLKNAKELLESYLQRVFENKDRGWEIKTLGDVCSLYQGIAINAKTKHALVEKSELPLLRIKDLKNNTFEQYIDPNNFPVNALVNEDDIIYTRTGSLGLVFRGKRGVLHNNSFKVVPTSELTKDYLFVWLQNPIFKAKIMGLAMKAAQPDITHAIFKIQEITIPPIKEQLKIVKNYDTLSIETKKLEAIYQQKINDLEELKKSILQKAFSGELKTEKAIA